MDLLVLGGTRFVGRHAVAAALARGHQVTLVHRSPTDLFPEAEHVLLDRTTGPDALAPLAGRTYDGLLDVCGYVPRVVRDSCRALAGSVGHGAFISSVSAYAPPVGDDITDAPLWPVGGLRDEGASEEVTNESYGPLKVACEQEFTDAFPTASIIRPTYVVGPDDYTDRFGYWVRRMSEGGDVLAAEPADAPMQLIDVRDLGAFTVHLIEERTAGAFDAVGPSADLHRRRHARGVLARLRQPGQLRARRRPRLAGRARGRSPASTCRCSTTTPRPTPSPARRSPPWTPAWCCARSRTAPATPCCGTAPAGCPR